MNQDNPAGTSDQALEEPLVQVQNVEPESDAHNHGDAGVNVGIQSFAGINASRNESKAFGNDESRGSIVEENELPRTASESASENVLSEARRELSKSQGEKKYANEFAQKQHSVAVFSKPESGPKGMPPEGKTYIFPREDNLYKKKQSLPYDEVQTKVWRDRPSERKKEQGKEWLVYMLVGLVSGTVAYGMIVTEEFLLKMQVVVIRTV